MKELLCFPLFFLLLPVSLIAQEFAAEFSISLPNYKVGNSLYNQIEFIDSRIDVTNFGIIRSSSFPGDLNVFPTVHLSKQLSNVFNHLIDSSAKDGKLMFQLRKFSFAVNGGRNELGYCFLKADMYSKVNQNFLKLNSVDTVILIRNPEVTDLLFLQTSNLINNFISSSLTQNPSDTAKYTLDNILDIEKKDREKKKTDTAIPFVDGLYLTYDSFISQVPDNKVTVKMKGDIISAVNILGNNNKKVKIGLKDIYALVYNGKIYIPTDLGYYPLLLE